MTEHVTVCDQAYDPSTTPKYDLHSVSSLTTYQLRQELVRLGAFERFFPPEKVQYCCYDSLLEAHITLLREAKAEEEAAAFARHNAEVEARKAQLAEAKAARMQDEHESEKDALFQFSAHELNVRRMITRSSQRRSPSPSAHVRPPSRLRTRAPLAASCVPLRRAPKCPPTSARVSKFLNLRRFYRGAGRARERGANGRRDGGRFCVLPPARSPSRASPRS